MWLFLKDAGFFSIVEKDDCQKGEVVVRARCRADIDKLRKGLLIGYGFKGKVIETPTADYACRMYVPKEIMAGYLSKAVMEIDYDNFKDTIPSKDRLRHDAYFDCWEAMYRWQGRIKQ